MTSALTKSIQGGDVATIDQKGFNEIALPSAGGGGDWDYLTLSGKTGIYKYGRDKSELDEHKRFVVIPTETSHGWTCWSGGKPVAKVDVGLSQVPPAEGSLEDHGPYKKEMDGWKAAYRFRMFDLDTGKQALFETTAKSGVNVLSDLISACQDRSRAGEPWVPIVSWDAEEFEAQGFTNFKPVFEEIVWVEYDWVALFLAGRITAAVLETGKAPKKRDIKKAA